MRGCIRGAHSPVDKADQIAKVVIAEYTMHRPAILLPDIGSVRCAWIRVAIQRAGKHAVVCCEPFETRIRGEPERFIRNRSFRGPEAGRCDAGLLRHVTPRAVQLKHGVLRVSEAWR